MKANIPMSLSEILLCAYGPNCDLAHSYPAAELFDARGDFVMDEHQTALAVLLTLTNDRRMASRDVPGLRRRISVSIIDTTASRVVNVATSGVTIPRDSLSATVRVDVPFCYTDVIPSHYYKISVRDELNGVLLGERGFQMYDIAAIGKEPSDWYRAERGGLLRENSYSFDFLRSVDAADMTYCFVRFDVAPRFRESPLILPELEIRVYFPDGKVVSRFFTPQVDEADFYEHYVQMPFYVNSDRRGICYAELLCMDYAIAGFAFSTAGPEIQGEYFGTELYCLDSYSLEASEERWQRTRSALNSGQDDASKSDSSETESDFDFDQALDRFISSEYSRLEKEEIESTSKDACVMDELDALIGLRSVKEKLHVYEKMVLFNSLRKTEGLPCPPIPLHAMFLGSPGTGKTTVARMMGRLLKQAGVLESGHVVVRERSTLLGPNYSMEETNTLKAIEEAKGGILLIDEAYQLYQPNDPRDPGKFVIEALMTALADETKRDWMLILAGYPEQMMRMFEMNPGLKSRIPESNIYTFEDFTEDELMQIADRYFESNRFSLSPDARVALSGRLGLDHSLRDGSFGNARHVINMIQTDILPAMAQRVMTEGTADIRSLTLIQAGDIPSRPREDRASRRRVGFRA